MDGRTVTREEVIELVRRLPREKLAEVYDFIAFVQSRATTVAVEDEADDWLNDDEEALAAEDALWDAVTARHADKRAQVEARIASAPGLPMFNEDGRWLVDDYTEQAAAQGE